MLKFHDKDFSSTNETSNSAARYFPDSAIKIYFSYHDHHQLRVILSDFVSNNNHIFDRIRDLSSKCAALEKKVNYKNKAAL